VATVQRADAHRERDVVGRLALLRVEILGGDPAQSQAPGCNLGTRRALACATALVDRSMAMT
jgi:hypothetical protein